MAWLKLTLQDGRTCLTNSDQVWEVWQSAHSCANAGIRLHDGVTLVRETVEEIAAMIQAAERRERVDRIFLAIVYNFPQGYDPKEIWDAARRLESARDQLGQVTTIDT
jgi:hypothetical protein